MSDSEITGVLRINKTILEDFDPPPPDSFHDDEQGWYITCEHEGGDVIGITNELFEDSIEGFFKPLPDGRIQCNQYTLIPMGSSTYFKDVSLFKVEADE